MSCGSYDVRLVDEDGDACELRDVSLCGSEQATLTQEDLLACQGW